MPDAHVNVSLTFATDARPSTVLEELLTAMRQHSVPYDLVYASCSSWDLDDEEEET